MAYASYEFYKTTFGGTAIPQEKWQNLALRADGLIKEYTFNKVESPVPEEVMLAACAIADVLFAFDAEKEKRNQFVKSENVDGLSVSYENFEETQSRKSKELSEAINTYLPRSHPLRYRGV